MTFARITRHDGIPGFVAGPDRGIGLGMGQHVLVIEFVAPEDADQADQQQSVHQGEGKIIDHGARSSSVAKRA